MATKTKKKDHPRANAWDKIAGQEIDQTTANRNVFEAQQLDRSKIDRKQGRTSRVVVALVVSVILTVLMWGAASVGQFVVTLAGGFIGDATGSSVAYTERVQESTTRYKYCILPQADAQAVTTYDKENAPDIDGVASVVDAAGVPIAGEWCFRSQAAVKQQPVPAWVVEAKAAAEAEKQAKIASGEIRENTIPNALTEISLWKVVLSLLTGLLTYGLMYPVMMRNLESQNLMNDTTDINQYAGDQHIALPEEIIRKFDWFPDAGAHSGVQVSSMISHVMLTNSGLKKIETTQHADQDVLDADGEIVFYRGEVLVDEDDRPLTKMQPLIDVQFGEDLFEASGIPRDKTLRRRFDASKIEYNPDGKRRDKLGTHKTVADLINADWTFPDYEVQRPAGAYLVDTAPVNTMVLAITRAGKGQTYIEPVIDMWLREKRPNNIVLNDPKGELLVKYYVAATLRGYQVTQFNLINAMKTDIYNPLGMAADAAREGDATKCALYVENIADVFFPLDGGEDPVWPNAANNAFKRAAYGLIDFYLEEERELRAHAARVSMDPKVLETRLDEMWGKVTLYNCYQLFVQLTSKKLRNPVKKVEDDAKAGVYGDLNDVDDFDEISYEADRQAAQAQAFLWGDAPEADLLTLYFNATQHLPQNSMRTLVSNADNALRAMGAAEKMLASVYGIAITAMSFFTDPTISTLTSGTPSQNTDLGGLSFPRRMGVRFGMNYLKRDHLIGSQARWDAFADDGFTESLGTDFEHADTVSREGWARYYFVGKFAGEVAYLRLRLFQPQSGMLIRTFYFRFTKDYQTSLSGRHYVTDPVTGAKIIKNGIVVELLKGNDGAYRLGHTTYPQERLVDITTGYARKEMSQAQAIISSMVRYSESPKAVFLVTPPHLMKYAKLILILIKQLVDLNFDKSYMTKADQKPLYKTRFMLDELGNLQSDGHGIAGFETMLSIGLGQEQQFTLILQTLQQLRDVYGESVDKIVQGNTSNIVFLKSTDDSMIDTLQKMSGTRHVVYRDSKTVTKDVERVIRMGNVEGKVSYTMSVREEPVISYNDMNTLSERNSIVFRAGDSPVWNRNETILPMSWRLFRDTIVHPGHEYSLQTIPTLSSALEFDVRMNQPDFMRMLAKRMKQAEFAQLAKKAYQDAYDYADVDVARLDPDVYSEEVMELVDESVRETAAEYSQQTADEITPEDIEGIGLYTVDPYGEFIENEEVLEATREHATQQASRQEKRYAGGQLSQEDLADADGTGKIGVIDAELVTAYKALHPDMRADAGHFFVAGDGSLRSRDGRVTYISKRDDTESLRDLQSQAKDPAARVYAEDDESIAQVGSYVVHREFYTYLASLPTWQDIARGEFESTMSRLLRQRV